jgi:hypothetical protein
MHAVSSSCVKRKEDPASKQVPCRERRSFPCDTIRGPCICSICSGTVFLFEPEPERQLHANLPTVSVRHPSCLRLLIITLINHPLGRCWTNIFFHTTLHRNCSTWNHAAIAPHLFPTFVMAPTLCLRLLTILPVRSFARSMLGSKTSCHLTGTDFLFDPELRWQYRQCHESKVP